MNGQSITDGEIATAVAARQRVADLVPAGAIPTPATPLAVDRGLVVDGLIDDTLPQQEATRRGLGCSAVEAVEQFRKPLAVPEGRQAVVVAAVSAGLAPAGYLQTPEAQRTPTSDSLIDAYFKDAGVVRALRQQCAISKLFASLTIPPDASRNGPNDERNQAIATLEAGLRAGATIDRKPGY